MSDTPERAPDASAPATPPEFKIDSAKYFVRSRKKFDARTGIEVWEISPVGPIGGSQEFETFEVYVEAGSRAQTDLLTAQNKIVQMVFDGEPNPTGPVKLLGIEREKQGVNGFSAAKLRDAGYPGYEQQADMPNEISVQPIKSDVLDAVDTNGHLRVFEDQVNVLGKIGQDYRKMDNLRHLSVQYALEGIRSERQALDESRLYYKDEIKQQLMPSDLPEGWNLKNVGLARYAKAPSFALLALPEINKKVTKDMIDRDPKEAQERMVGILSKHMDPAAFNLQEVSQQLLHMEKAERADLAMLLTDEAGSAAAKSAHDMAVNLEAIMGDGDQASTNGGYLLSANMKLSNQIGKDGASMLASVKERLRDVEFDEAGNVKVTDKVKADMDILYPEGDWTPETVKWIRSMNVTVFEQMNRLDDAGKLKLVDSIEQLSYADNARSYYNHAEDSIKNKRVEFPSELGEFLGRNGKVYNMNYNKFISHPDDTKRLTTQPVQEYGSQVAQDMVDFYSQQALYDTITKETAMTFAKNQVDLADKGYIPAPNPAEFDEISVTKGRFGRQVTAYQPKEEMMAKSWEISQAAGAQVMSQLAHLTYGKSAPDQYVHEDLTHAVEPFASKNDLGATIEAFRYVVHKSATEVNPDASPEKATQLTHLKRMADANFGVKDTRLFKKDIDPKIKAGAVMLGMLGTGMVINQIEGLDASFS